MLPTVLPTVRLCLTSRVRIKTATAMTVMVMRRVWAVRLGLLRVRVPLVWVLVVLVAVAEVVMRGSTTRI